MVRLFMTVEDIAADLSLSKEEAAGLAEELDRRLEAAGKYVIPGRIPAVWYRRQKVRGFMDTREGRVPLAERRLLSIEEFCEYAGGSGLSWRRSISGRSAPTSILGKGSLWTR